MAQFFMNSSLRIYFLSNKFNITGFTEVNLSASETVRSQEGGKVEAGTPHSFFRLKLIKKKNNHFTLQLMVEVSDNLHWEH
jgi:hypothetical protein